MNLLRHQYENGNWPMAVAATERFTCNYYIKWT